MDSVIFIFRKSLKRRAHEQKTTIPRKCTLKTAEPCPRNWLELSGELWLGELGLVPLERFSVFGTLDIWEEAWS